MRGLMQTLHHAQVAAAGSATLTPAQQLQQQAAAAASTPPGFGEPFHPANVARRAALDGGGQMTGFLGGHQLLAMHWQQQVRVMSFSQRIE